MKHASGWEPTPAAKNEPPGWMSPAGRTYNSESQDWEPTIWPDIPDPETWPDFERLYPEPPIEDPPGENLVDPDDLPADDDLWEEFYAMPFVLPTDPCEDWEQAPV